MQPPKHLLVIRFSAMGDVAMIVPVVKQALQQNSGLQITVVSNAFFEPLFKGLENCYFYPAHLKDQHKGMVGIIQLFRELKQVATFDGIVDLHSVLRSHLLRTLFRLFGIKTATIDKGRADKKALIRKEGKELKPLPTMHKRYAAVFQQIGIKVQLNPSEIIYPKLPLPERLKTVFAEGKRVIGVAPFAQYVEKMYPLEKMKRVVELLLVEGYVVLLFGGGQKETIIFQQWQNEFPAAINIAGNYSFEEQLAAISNLQIMVSMDSANMHLASLFAVPVISIWGATHPYAGFYGWGQEEQNMVQVALGCRPCSVFGNKSCFRGDHACMNFISQDEIVHKVKKIFSSVN